MSQEMPQGKKPRKVTAKKGVAAKSAEMPVAEGSPAPVVAAPPVQPAMAEGSLVVQTLERQLRPGEVSLDDLEWAVSLFRSLVRS